ncbi:MAG TPA: HNH endonuclease [Candidatus Limnocylindrales bacterium]
MTASSAPSRKAVSGERAPGTDPQAWLAHVTCVDVTEPLCRFSECRQPLPPRRTAFCSDRHARAFERNHVWIHARRAARRRAGWACQRCGFKPSEARRDPAARRSLPRSAMRLEVNHIEPLAGAYRGVTCSNHLENLEVLCHACHLATTDAQRARRRGQDMVSNRA